MRKPGSECEFEGCLEEVHARGLCPAHHAQWYNGGYESLRPVRIKDPAERFWSYVSKPEDPNLCWGWNGPVSGDTGRFRADKRAVLAHVFSWELHNSGRVESGMEVDHFCRNRTCTNPRHLRLVTRSVNQQNRTSRKGSKSRYKGVTWHKAKQAWVGRVMLNGKRVYVTSSKTDEKAVALACLKFRIENWPEPNLYDSMLSKELGIDYPFDTSSAQNMKNA